jgi:hypothetical protein
LLIEFLCNICGGRHEQDSAAFGREDRSCPGCLSTVRWRSIVYCLSQGLFSRSYTLADLPEDKSIKGIGLSDVPIYAKVLEQKFSYTNTHYHKEPQFDITKLPKSFEDSMDFLISSDVYEHVTLPVSTAFENSYKLLRTSGFMILTVPFALEGETKEWFPRLHQYEITDFLGEKILINKTVDDVIEVHRNLCFHGGSGDTLEMRLFSLPGLVSELTSAGFKHLYSLDKDLPDWGIFNKGQASFPLLASKLELSIPALSPIALSGKRLGFWSTMFRQPAKA